MLIFVVCVALMTLTALASILLPLLRVRSNDPAAQRLRALDAARDAGIIDAAEHARQSALPLDGHSATTPRRTPGTVAAALLLALLIPTAALALYRLVGTPQAIDAASTQAPAEQAALEMPQAIAALVARLKEHPDDVQGWVLLGRAYTASGQPEQAVDALRHAHELTGDDAQITVEYAQALALATPGHRIDGEPAKLLEAVLTREPQNQRALWLLGIADFQSGRYDAAIARWNTLLPLLESGSTVASAVQRQIEEARALRDGKPVVNAAAPPPAQTRSAAAPSAGTARLTVQVSLDPALKSQADPEATLFVFARAAKGPPMPLAIERHKASELPLTVTLDDSTAMMPSMKLSDFPEVVVGARISRSGQATPQSGDLQALSAPVDVKRKEPLALEIKQRVP